MKVVVLYGQHHKGSTYHIVEKLLQELGVNEEETKAFYFSAQEHCVGCFNCILKGEEYCPHYDQVAPVLKAMEEADVIIMASPCYCVGITGSLKSFLDHLAYIWMVHRPRERMFHKIGIAVSTTAGAGARKVTKDLAQQMFYWGIPKVYRLGIAVAAGSWEHVSDKNKNKIDKAAKRIAHKVKAKNGRVKAGIRQRMFFALVCHMRSDHGDKTGCIDNDYWKKMHWTQGKRPWKENDNKA